ncbi:MAG: DinB family protein [Acidobacteria bacterium]|nr:DinB family protein [Acidobacteriota bacterium]
MPSLELEDYARQIDSANAAAKAIVDNHSSAELTKPTAAGGWSPAECIAHIAKTLEVYLPSIRAALADGRAQGLTGEGPFHYGFFARMFLWMIEPPVRLRTKTPTVFAPRPQPDVQPALDSYLRLHRELQRLLQEADGLDLAAIRVVSPANAKLKLPVGAVFGVLTAHARRHLWQARRALSESGT